MWLDCISTNRIATLSISSYCKHEIHSQQKQKDLPKQTARPQQSGSFDRLQAGETTMRVFLASKYPPHRANVAAATAPTTPETKPSPTHLLERPTPLRGRRIDMRAAPICPELVSAPLLQQQTKSFLSFVHFFFSFFFSLTPEILREEEKAFYLLIFMDSSKYTDSQPHPICCWLLPTRARFGRRCCTWWRRRQTPRPAF